MDQADYVRGKMAAIRGELSYVERTYWARKKALTLDLDLLDELLKKHVERKVDAIVWCVKGHVVKDYNFDGNCLCGAKIKEKDVKQEKSSSRV